MVWLFQWNTYTRASFKLFLYKDEILVLLVDWKKAEYEKAMTVKRRLLFSSRNQRQLNIIPTIWYKQTIKYQIENALPLIIIIST